MWHSFHWTLCALQPSTDPSSTLCPRVCGLTMGGYTGKHKVKEPSPVSHVQTENSGKSGKKIGLPCSTHICDIKQPPPSSSKGQKDQGRNHRQPLSLITLQHQKHRLWARENIEFLFLPVLSISAQHRDKSFAEALQRFSFNGNAVI